MSSIEKLLDMWRRAEMTPKKLLLIVVMLAVCTLLAYGVTVGSDAGSTSTVVTTTSTG